MSSGRAVPMDMNPGLSGLWNDTLDNLGLGVNNRLPKGYQQYQYSDPTPAQSYFTSAKAAQMGYAPQGARNFQNAQAAQLGQTADMGQSRQGMWNQLGTLQQQAAGQGLLAPLMMQQNQDATLQNMMRVNAQNRSTAGGSAYSGQAGVLGLNLQGQQQAAQQAAQERLNAQGQMAGLLNSIYGQDAEQMARNADYQQQANMYNAQGRNQMTQADMDRLYQWMAQNGAWQQEANMRNAGGMSQYGGLLNSNNMWRQSQMGGQQDALNQYWLGQQNQVNQGNRKIITDAYGNVINGASNLAMPVPKPPLPASPA